MITQRTHLSPEPVVILENAFHNPFDNAVATARTCYSSKVIHAADVSRDDAARLRRDALARSIYKAGHHTTIQHATFQFVLDKVSRQAIWSFLHSHPFYNSEQVSQRYVEMKAENFTTPALQEDHVPPYQQAIRELMDAYHEISRLVEPTVLAEYRRIFKVRDLSEKRWQSAIKKRCQEVARYVLPVATHAHLYHTISGLTLHRYHRLCRQFDVPDEQRIVVQKMVEAVNQSDPDFFKFIEDPLPLELTLEFQILSEYDEAGRAPMSRQFIREFDAQLGGYSSKLIDSKPNAEAVLAQSVRSVLGLPSSAMNDDDAIDAALNPARNPYFSESLNLTSLSKLTRTLVHPHFTFKKKISHTADSQDQRHRMTPASRPVLIRQVLWDRPDYIVPALIQNSPEALPYYHETMERVWSRMAQLVESGAREADVQYLLPNAFPIRFEESGDLLNFHHKWTHRLCYTAQEEIWKTS
ncbi:MAG TPA: FAD-dependent thymidylate synthase, partial [Elusimicrobiota bacterium]|nr:FAD-dependent thymidylate synthase [Elusimicrobiota bacterium]